MPDPRNSAVSSLLVSVTLNNLDSIYHFDLLAMFQLINLQGKPLQ